MKFSIPIFLLFFSISLKSQIITTIAGGKNSGYSGDGGLAINALLGGMYNCDPAFDNAGNMYICQNANNTIRKIDKNGIITTIAGANGIAGYSGDNGPATAARLFHPTAMAVDNANNIYFVDRDRTIIRKIDAAGIITTASAQTTNTCGVGDGGPLSLAKFKEISAIVFDKLNNMYISDIGCNTVRKVNNAGIISTIAGNGSSGFSGDGGPATLAQLSHPGKVGIDNAGYIYIPDANNHRIRKVNPAGTITTFAGTGTAAYNGNQNNPLQADLYLPGSVVVDNIGNLFIGEASHVIRAIDPAGRVTNLCGAASSTGGYSGDGNYALWASMDLTEGLLSIDNNNNVYFSNYPTAYAIRKICAPPVVTKQPATATSCISGSATFSVTATNTTVYQWQENTGSGWTNLIDNSTYSGTATGTLVVTGITTGMNNYQYRCAFINSCTTIYSSAASLLVKPLATPTISLVMPSTSICEGAPTTFTAAVTNHGTAPGIQWLKNGAPVGTNSISYTDNRLNTGDVISCRLISNATCLTTNTVTSNALTLTVTPNVMPSVTISPSDNNICYGKPITFSSSITNGGSTPRYTWFKNGINLFLNSPTYTDNALNNGDVIMCAFMSDLTCVISPVVPSVPVTVAVNPLITPSITIAASAGGSCKNTPVEFSATVMHGGTAPVYQWQKNGATVGLNSDRYTDNTLVNGDIITCTLTSNSTDNCITTKVVTSNAIAAIIYPDPVVKLNKDENICEGNDRILDAGTFASYSWNTGETSQRITINSTGSWSVTVTDKNGCTATDYVNVTTVIPSPKHFLPSDTAICSYGSISIRPNARFRNYNWSTGSNEFAESITKAGDYWLQVVDDNGCIGTDSIRVNPKYCLAGFFMPTAFSPNHDGKNDLLKPVLLGNIKKYQFRIYNRWGQQVFASSDHTKGWDGTINGVKQGADNYAWICIYQFNEEPQVTKKGTFVLIR